MPTPGPGTPVGPGPDGSTPERDGRFESLPGSNGKRPSSLKIIANLDKKRKARDMEGTGDVYNTTHVRSRIKKEPGLPIDDSQIYRGRTSPTTSPIKQEPSIDDVLQGRDNDNDNSGEDTSRPSLGFDDSMPTVKQEADSVEHNSRETSDIQDMTSSSDLTQPDVWNVSETEFHTSQAEEDSSDGESVGSAFSLGMEREESGKPNGPSRGHDNHYGDESDEIPSRRGSVQDPNSISRKRPNKPVANGSNTVEQDSPTRSILHDHDSQARDESSEIPENGQRGRNKVTTAAGKPRQRAQPKNHISARDISRSWKTANPADKMLMKMKEKGCDWLEIRKAWQELTGEWPAQSTLPNRYKRVKDNLTRMKPGDGQRLLDAAADVEAQFLRAKWRLIAEAMERAGASKYSNAFIQKKYDELLRNPGKRGSLIDDESSDASESDPVPREHDVARLQHPGADSTMSAITSGFGTSVLGDDESPGSGQRQRHGPPLEPKVAISREEAKYMARHKALNASNRAKPWEIIAQECGITAPLNDITEALERAGYIDARGSSREADPDRSARMSRSGERRQARRTNGPHRGASKEIMVSKQARKGVYPSVHGNTRPLTGTTTLQRRGTPQLPTERDEPDQARKQSQPVIKPQSASISESSPDRIEPVQAKKKALLALAPRVTRGTHSGKRHRQPRPYECKSCLGKYRKRSGLGAHWKRNPGCDPETRRSKAAKTVPKGTTTEWAPGASKNETIAGSSAHTPMMQMIFEISSREPTPEISG